jgi:single-stranded-DNA-specific exonuclease
LCREGNICRGSARSIPGINIYEALESCKDLLIKYGGHGFAAGLTIPAENVDGFNARINEYAKARLSGISLTPLVNFDMEIFPKNISLGLADELKMLEPFGSGNPSPSFACRNLLVQEIRTVGASDKHLKMKLSGLSETFDAIAFNMGYNIDGYSKGDNVDVICELDKNVWNGREDIQLIVRDIRTSIQKSLENNYYRSFKYFIENIMLNIPFEPHVIGEFGLYEKPIENII